MNVRDLEMMLKLRFYYGNFRNALYAIIICFHCFMTTASGPESSKYGQRCNALNLTRSKVYTSYTFNKNVASPNVKWRGKLYDTLYSSLYALIISKYHSSNFALRTFMAYNAGMNFLMPVDVHDSARPHIKTIINFSLKTTSKHMQDINTYSVVPRLPQFHCLSRCS